MEFEIEKRQQLEKKDKSDKGKIDDKISNLCEKINKNSNYYTTSSCSGRIVLIKSAIKIPNIFLFKSHEKLEFKEFKEILENAKEKSDKIYFKFESIALHVCCKTLENAFNLLEKAREIGLKRSGIISNSKNNKIVCEICSTESLQFPICKNNKILINDDFLQEVLDDANKKLESGWIKIKKLENCF